MKNHPSDLPVFEPDPFATYTIDVVAAQTGVAVPTILHYQEHGLIVPMAVGSRDAARYDDDALRALRRIEHLRASGALNLDGVKLLFRLMSEVERLRADLRAHH